MRMTHTGRRPRAPTALALALALGVFAAVGAQQNQENDTRALEGRRFRCCTLVEDPHVYVDKHERTHGGFSGLALDYLDHLEDNLGFSCGKLILYKNNEFPGFSGFVNYMRECSSNGNTSNCMCDFGVGGWARTPQRLGKVDFIAPYTNDNYVIVTSLSNVQMQGNSSVFFLAPFGPWVWVAIFSIFVLHAGLHVFDTKFAACPPSDAPPKHLSFPRRMWHMMTMTRLSKRVGHATYSTWMAFLGHNAIDGDPSVYLRGKMQSMRQRIIVIFALLCGLFLTLAYESGLVLQLFTSQPVSPFQSVDDFKECRISMTGVCVPSSGATERYWLSAILPARAACEASTVPPRGIGSYTGGFQAVANGSCKYFTALGSSAVRAVNRRHCGKVFITGKPFFPTSLSYVFPLGSPLTETFSNVTLTMRQQGMLVEASDYSSARSCEPGDATRLNWSKLQSFFYTAYALWFVLVLLTIFDLRRKPKTSVQEGDQDEDLEKGVSQKRLSSEAPSDTTKVLTDEIQPSPETEKWVAKAGHGEELSRKGSSSVQSVDITKFQSIQPRGGSEH